MKKMNFCVILLIMIIVISTASLAEEKKINKVGNYVYHVAAEYEYAGTEQVDGGNMAYYINKENNMMLFETIMNYEADMMLHLTNEMLASILSQTMKETIQESMYIEIDGGIACGRARGSDGEYLVSVVTHMENGEMLVVAFVGEEYIKDDELDIILKSIKYVDKKDFDYKAISRNPEKFKGERYLLRGEVFQVVGSYEDECAIRFAVENDSDQILLIYIPQKTAPSYNLLEGDELFVDVVMDGTITYEAIWGNEITIPYAVAEAITLIEDEDEKNNKYYVELPDLPQKIDSYIDYKNTKISSVMVTGIKYESTDWLGDDALTLLFSGEKVYDYNGEENNDGCWIGWKLYDEEGYVVKTGTVITQDLKKGEKFRGTEKVVFDLEPGHYRLELIDVK